MLGGAGSEREEAMASDRARRRWWTGLVGLLFLSLGVDTRAQTARPSGRGFVAGGALGGGQLSFGGAEDLSLALSPVTGQIAGPYGSYDTRSAWVVRKGESVPEAERVVPFANEAAGGFSMHVGYAFSPHVAVLLDVGVWAGNFNQAIGGPQLRVWPTRRMYVAAGPSFGDLRYGFEGSVVGSGLDGSGFTAAAGVSMLRRARWSLDLETRYNRLGYDGFHTSTLLLQLGASLLPRRPTTGS
jgi:opacity protein-like surface antigen